MRDLLVTAFVLGSLPFIIRKPFLGILMWALLSLMNPGRLCWGFALSIPFAQIVAITLFFSLLITTEKKNLPSNSLLVLLGLFWAWMFITTLQAFAPELAWGQLNKVAKILLLTFVTIMMLNSKIRIVSLVSVIVISLGFYGVKGGIFTLLTGGQYHVLGPPGTFIGENNALGLAVIMTIPLMRFLQLQLTGKYLKRSMGFGLAMMFVAVAGSQSRGAFIALVAMVSFLLSKSSRRGILLVGLALLLPAIFLFMPDSWVSRMESILNYEQDSSAMARINAWITFWRIASDYPIFGGGFEVFASWAWNVYSPNPKMHFDVHSIYFEALGEHGFVGFFLFLGIGLLSFYKLGKIVRLTKDDERLSWMKDLASMIQVSIVGYATGGLFLGMAYFDFYYFLVALTIGLETLLRTYQKNGIPESDGVGLFHTPENPDSATVRSTRYTGNRRAKTKRRVSQSNGKTRHPIKSWYNSL